MDLRAGAVAVGQQRARKREAALGAQRLGIAEEGPDGRGRRALLPKQGLGTTAERDVARPARVGGDERAVAREVDVIVVAPQDRPLDQLARERIRNAALDRAGLGGLAGPREADGLLDGFD